MCYEQLFFKIKLFELKPNSCWFFFQTFFSLNGNIKFKQRSRNAEMLIDGQIDQIKTSAIKKQPEESANNFC